MSTLIDSPRVFKPMRYPKAFEYWDAHDKMKWFWDETPLSEDVRDFAKTTEEEREFITGVMRLFTQNDVEVGHGYDVLLRIFKPTEVSMMLRSFADRENTHIAAYSLFTETLGFKDEFYTSFINDKTMSEKIKLIESSQVLKYEQYEKEWEEGEEIYNEPKEDYIYRRYRQDIMYMLAVYAAGTEGISLFAQFAMLLKFQLLGRFKGLGTIVEWSIKDEEMHVQGNSWLFRTFVAENMDVFDDIIKKRIYDGIRNIVDKEIELVHELNPPHMDKEQVIEYIKYIADQRLKLIGFKPNYNIETNPLPYMEELSTITLTNMFEGRVTEYTKNATEGTWEEVRNGSK